MTTNYYNYSYNNNNNTTKTINDTPIAVATTVLEPLAPPESPQQQRPLSERQLRRLQEQGFTHSLAMSLEDVKKAFALRIWIVDNSGSMNAADGHRLITTSKNNVRTVDCTRWAEISACIEFHIRLSALIEAPTRFRLLNRPRSLPGTSHADFSVAEGNTDDSAYEAELMIQQLRQVRPAGCTPLTSHVHDIRRQILEMEPMLRRNDQRVAVIIATDGLPTDERGRTSDYERSRFVEALRQLEGLPIWVVIRLCTDEESVVDFYNDLDAILELSIDVLDDFIAEAEEIREFNPWLNYGLTLHRLREMGHPDRLFDLIDERAFTKSEVRDFCSILFGDMDGVPDAAADWKGFLAHLARLNQNEGNQWHPLKRRPKPWVSINKLRRGRTLQCGR